MNPIPSGVHRIYLCGPMSGLPDNNLPAFEEATAALRLRGLAVASPVEMDAADGLDPAEQVTPGGAVWAGFLARDLRVVTDPEVDAVVVLPGWRESKGARLEVHVASELGKPILTYPGLQTPAVHLTRQAQSEAHVPWRNYCGECGSRGCVEGCPSCSRVRVPEAPVTPVAASGEHRVTNPVTGGEKGSKPQRMDLVPMRSVMDVSEVYGFGAAKYADWNWRRGYEWSLSIAALQRHLSAWQEGQDTDDESGLSHLAHAGFHVLTLLTFTRDHPELDDRYKAEK